MDINLTNLNDLAQKILEEDLCKSYDILHEHMDVLKTIDCQGQTFLVAVFCKAIDEGDISFCQQHLPHLFCAHYTQRKSVIMHAMAKNISFEYMQILLENDFNSQDHTQEKPVDNLEILTCVACVCAGLKHWDVLNWIMSCFKDNDDIEFVYRHCHYYNINTFRHVHIPLDAIISVLYYAIDPSSREDLNKAPYKSHEFLAAITSDTLQTIDNVLQNMTSDNRLFILCRLCMYIYYQNTKHLISYLQKPEVVDVLQTPKNRQDVYKLITLCFFLNIPHAAQQLLEIMQKNQPNPILLRRDTVHAMVWRNVPTWIFSKYVSKYDATLNFPFAVAYNHKEIGFLLLDIGVDLSQTINWEEIKETATHFDMVKAGNNKEHCVWQERLDNWVSEYEKSVLEIALDGVDGCESQRKI